MAAALTGRTAEYGLHLDQYRQSGIAIKLTTPLNTTADFGALGKTIGEKIRTLNSKNGKSIPFIQGVDSASLEQLKTFCASLATYGGLAIFHMQGVTPEAQQQQPIETLTISKDDLEYAHASLNDALSNEVDFVSLGCPHLSIREIAHLSELLQGKKVTKEFWITTARPTKQIADRMGYTAIIEASGAKFAADTCCVVAPIRGRFHAMATDSAKACYYAYAKNQFKTRFLPFDEVVQEALT